MRFGDTQRQALKNGQPVGAADPVRRGDTRPACYLPVGCGHRGWTLGGRMPIRPQEVNDAAFEPLLQGLRVLGVATVRYATGRDLDQAAFLDEGLDLSGLVKQFRLS